MKSTILKFTLLLSLFSVSILRGQSTPAKVMPVITFDKKLHDFGTIKTGESPTFVFTFTNTGNAPLDIDQITGCDCTELDWTRTTVAPGGKGTVTVKYNSSKAEPEEHKIKLDKYVDIVLKQKHPVSGYVIPESVKFNVYIAD
jgi:Protein of unknown function (DUF1573)